MKRESEFSSLKVGETFRKLKIKSLGLPKINRHSTLINLSNSSKFQYSRIPQYSVYYIKMG